MQIYLTSLDGYLQMAGKLTANFKWQNYFTEWNETETIQFEDFYDILSKWSMSPEQEILNYSDFAAADERAAAGANITDFKKMTDRVV